MDSASAAHKPATDGLAMLPSFPPSSAAAVGPLTYSPSGSTHAGDEAADASGGVRGYYHDDATLMPAAPVPLPPAPPQHQHHLGQQQQERQAFSTPPPPLVFDDEGDCPTTVAALQENLLRLVEVLEAENSVLEALAMGLLPQQQRAANSGSSGGHSGDGDSAVADEVTSTIQDLRDARTLLEAYEAERQRLAGECEALRGREAAVARWAGLDSEEVEVLLAAGDAKGETGITPPPALRRALAAARRERDGLEERVAELRQEVQTATRRAAAAAAEASASVRAAALEAQVRALEGRLQGVGALKQERDAARVELAAARAAADNATTRVASLEAEVAVLRRGDKDKEERGRAGDASPGVGALEEEAQQSAAEMEEVRARMAVLDAENAGLRSSVTEANARAARLQAELTKARERYVAASAAASASPFAGGAGGRKKLDAAFAGVDERAMPSRAALLLAQGSPSTAADAERLRQLAGEVEDVLTVAGATFSAVLEGEREAMLSAQIAELEGIRAAGAKALDSTRRAVVRQGRLLLRAQAAGAVVACWHRWRRRERREPNSMTVEAAFAWWRWVVREQQHLAPRSPLEGGGVEEAKASQSTKSRDSV